MFIDYPGKSTIYIDTVSPENEENLANILACENTSPSLCNKLIKRDFWIEFNIFAPQEISYFEDRYVITHLYFYAKKISKTNKAFYHYTHSNINAITRVKTEIHFENVILFWKLMDDFLKKTGTYTKHEDIVNLAKIRSKVRLIIDTNSYSLRKKYYFMFRDFEMKYIHNFRRGEKIMLFFIHYKLFFLAQLFYKVLLYKNRNAKNIYFIFASNE